jgi:endonuclease YncB( thermonuclease family)
VVRKSAPPVERLLLVAFVTVALLAVAPGSAVAETLQATLVRVVDGDTLEVTVLSSGAPPSERRMVRLLGVDAPESAQTGGAEAALFVREWMGPVPDLVIEVESTDRYGRVVAEVFRADRTDDPSLNAALLAGGHAWWYREYAPDREDFARLERTARETRRGLWGNDDPVEPWVWRRRR